MLNKGKDEVFKVITTPHVRKFAYLISSKGRIYSMLSGKFLRCYLDDDGYYNISLLTDETYSRRIKRFRLNRLVAYEFIPNPNNLPVVNHIDGNKTNNFVSNLEWCTVQENTIHAERTGLRNVRGESNGNCKYTDDYAHTICQLINEGYDNFSIFKLFYPNNKTSDKFNEYMFICRLRERKLRPDITSQYDFPSKNTYKDPTRIQIISLLYRKYKVKDILNYYGFHNKTENLDLYNKIINIKTFMNKVQRLSKEVS